MMEEKFEITEIEPQNAPWTPLLQEYGNACDSENLEEIKKIIKSQAWKKYGNKKWLNDGFEISCVKGNLNIVKFFFNSKELEADYDINTGFVHAVKDNKIEVVKYLLTSPELKNHSDIHYQNDGELMDSCQRGNLEILKYLTSSPDLKEHIDIHIKKDLGFKEALRKKQTSILEYMIIELNFEKTEQINKHLIDYPNPDAEKMFIVRNMYNNLNKELTLEDELIVKKNKI